MAASCYDGGLQLPPRLTFRPSPRVDVPEIFPTNISESYRALSAVNGVAEGSHPDSQLENTDLSRSFLPQDPGDTGPSTMRGSAASREPRRLPKATTPSDPGIYPHFAKPRIIGIAVETESGTARLPVSGVQRDLGQKLHDMFSTTLSVLETFGAHGLDGVSSLYLIVRTGGRFEETQLQYFHDFVESYL